MVNLIPSWLVRSRNQEYCTVRRIRMIKKKHFFVFWPQSVGIYCYCFGRSRKLFWHHSIHIRTVRSYALSFYRSQNVLCWSNFFVHNQKFIYTFVAVTNILCQTKRWFAFSKIGFWAGTKVFEEALNAIKFLECLKTFAPAQNILGPVKGQGIRPPSIQLLKLQYIW